MGRPVRFTREKISEAALALVADGGPSAATIDAIARRLGAPTGSIYHRYGSRSLLLAELWLTTVEDFQRGLIAAMKGNDPVTAGVEAALYTPRWVRTHPREARLLLLHRREDLVGGAWPAEVRARAECVRRDLTDALRDLTRRRSGRVTDGSLTRTAFAVIDVPYGALKRYLTAGKSVPPLVDAMIATAARAVLDEKERG